MFLIVANYEGHSPFSVNTAKTEKQAKALVQKLKKNHAQEKAFYCAHPGGDIAFWRVDPQTQSVIYDQEADESAKQEQDLKLLRAERNKRLADTDWTQMPDAPLTEAEKTSWAEYRQALRDLPKQTKNITHCVWPRIPGE